MRMRIDESQLKTDMDKLLEVYNRLNKTNYRFEIQDIRGGFPGSSMGHDYMLISDDEQRCIGNSENSTHSEQYIFNRAIAYLSEKSGQMK